MSNWLQALLRKVGLGRTQVTASVKSSEPSPKLATAVTPSKPKPHPLPHGDFVVRLTSVGFLEDRVLETLQTVARLGRAEAYAMVTAVPTVILRGVDENSAYKVQQELQMFGAAVEVMRQEAPDKKQLSDQAAPSASKKEPSLAQNAPQPDWHPNDYNVFLLLLGPQPTHVVPVLREKWGKYQTLPATQHWAELCIKRATPLFFGRSQVQAVQLADELNALGAQAVVFHNDDPQKPTYNHNQYGLILKDAGPQPQQVAVKLAALLNLAQQDAEKLVEGLPQSLLENVAVIQAIDIAEQLNEKGAVCDIRGPQENVWLNVSTDHIQPQAGSYRIVLQQVGVQHLLATHIVQNLLAGELTADAAAELVANPPQLLMDNIDLATAELIHLKLSDVGAALLIQTQEDAVHHGALHEQNANFIPGEYDVVLHGYDRFSKIKLIKALCELRPGIQLSEAKALVEMLPAVLVSGVDETTAVDIQAQLQALDAEVTLQKARS